MKDAATDHADSALIDLLGGSVATAALCEVTSQAVSQWRRQGIPPARRMYLRLLRPDVFEARADERTAAAAQAS
ncbi:MAG: helix-turn-helix domain-containing protein [Rubrivivax sp.]|nr:helix-turn-helix domain-containing protein [Rubrivivax sp.]MDH5338782.1 helix-turn-helix domain-containing protein [Rubrivivax sp.]